MQLGDIVSQLMEQSYGLVMPGVPEEPKFVQLKGGRKSDSDLALLSLFVFLCLFMSSYGPYGIPYGIPYGLDLFWRRLGPGSERGQPGASLHVPTAMCLCGHSPGKLPQGQQLRLLPPQASAKAKYLRQEAAGISPEAQRTRDAHVAAAALEVESSEDALHGLEGAKSGVFSSFLR